ncbi:glycosyltransferase family 4 protein [Flavobacteriaceae bacterium]|nr:glycosyltransferase family 4 protein [Flavobacteriaceae bacterium]
MAQKIKVFIDTFYYQAALSGIRTYINELFLGAKNSKNNNIEYLFSHDINHWDQNHKFLNPKSKLSRLYFHLYYFFWKQIILPFKILKHKPNVLICPDYVAPLWRLKTLKLCVIHDTLFWDYPKNYSALWRKYYIKLISLGLRGNSSIITTSNYVKSNLESLFSKQNFSINVIYQSFIKSKTDDDRILKTLNLKDSDFLFHVGSFDKRKDLITLVKAFKLLKEDKTNKHLKLVLTGQKIINGNIEVLNELQSYILTNNLSKCILMTGYLSDAEISSLYKKALIYVFPSVEEGFGIPILEAFAMRTPVVASNAAAMVEIAEGAAEHYNAGDHIELFKTLSKLITSKSKRTYLVEKGTERLKGFSRERFVKDYERLILKSVKN